MFAVHSVTETRLFIFAFVAASWDHAELVPTLLHAGVDLNAIDRLGNTALHFLIRKQGCAKKFDVDLVGQLIKAGAKCDIANADGQNASGKVASVWKALHSIDSFTFGRRVHRLRQSRLEMDAHRAILRSSRTIASFVEELISKRGANVNAIAKQS
jgi:ankyrin repeat protein